MWTSVLSLVFTKRREVSYGVLLPHCKHHAMIYQSFLLFRKCPLCDEDVNGTFSDEAAKKKVLALEMKCPSRCKWRGTLQGFLEVSLCQHFCSSTICCCLLKAIVSIGMFSFQKHKNECRFDMVKCRNKACKELVKREELEKHLQEECQHREIGCEYCDQRITIANKKVRRLNY